MKTSAAFFIVFLFYASLTAQTTGREALNAGMYLTAKTDFRQQLSNVQTQGEALYYLGEACRLLGQTDSAAFYFEKGVTAAVPNPLCMAGKAGLLLSASPDQAEELIKKARTAKNAKKNPALYVAIAKAYAANKQIAKAFDYLNQGKDVDEKYTDLYLTEGDILLEESGISGEAATRFEIAIYFDPTCKPAYLKVAWIHYKAQNYEQATAYLDKLKAIDAHFPPYLKLAGDIFYDQGQYNEAVRLYAEYVQSPEATLNDQIRYSYALFFNKNYQKSLEEIERIISQNPGNHILKRLTAYNLYETEKFQKGLEQMQAFMNTADPANIIPSDYKYYGRLLAKNGQDSLAVANFLKAANLGDSSEEVNREVIQLYEKMGKYKDAALYFEKHFGSKGVATSDLFLWGRDCYFAAGKIDSAAIAQNPAEAEARKTFYHTADSLFAEVIKRSPDSYLGYFWRARIHAILDPESELGLAKPFYEKVIAILENSGKNKKELIESYQYLGYYYYIKNDLPNSQIFWEKILSIDPENHVAREAVKGMRLK